MTLDEAIQRENKIAEENQKIVDTQIVFDDVSISELYCDDTEAIEEHLSNYRKCAEYHKQITDWLEELKMYKSLAPRELISEKHKNDIAIEYNKGFEYGFKTGYKKAIDDFANGISEYLGVENATKYGNKNAEQQRISYDTLMKYEIADAIDDISEQLKAGIAND